MLLVGQTLFRFGYFIVFGVDHAGILVDMLLAQLYLKSLELDLLRQQVKLAIVPHVVDLLLVFCYLGL